ncbi:cytochrome P450 2G1-like [Anomaloglossus baeobatrachus]|uniref:cytochrome P450 2G1-like n=1 Tax=Anomaloglossus baeobatrachus TaxID=238106 RepID=UPI003F4FE968
MDITWLGLLILICLFMYLTWDTRSRRCNLPPGPAPLPLIGNLLQIKREKLVNSLIKLWDQYGSVYTLHYGSQPVVVLCGYEAVKEALVDQGEVFGDRGPIPLLERFTQGYGFSLSNGERWKILRTFTVKTLKSFGFGKKSDESKIQEEAQCIVEEFRKYNGHPVDPAKYLIHAFSNVLCAYIFGAHFDYKEQKFTKKFEILDDYFYLASSTWGQLLTILPTFVRHFLRLQQRFTWLSKDMIEFVHDRVKSSLETLDPTSPRHFIDSFLIKMEEEKNNPSTEFHLRNLLIITRNLFIAGVETMNTTMRFGLLILLKYPEVQAKLHDEIDRVLGRNRLPNFDDRLQMHYMQAVIHEIQRFCDIAPLNVPHMVTRDIQFRGYQIPKGTAIYPLLCTVHRDPKHFSSPWEFNPNHFLDESGKFKKNEAFLPFSAGKRICPGENLARIQLFIFLNTILQNFELTSPIKLTEIEVTKMQGFLNAPIKFELSFLPR